MRNLLRGAYLFVTGIFIVGPLGVWRGWQESKCDALRRRAKAYRLLMVAHVEATMRAARHQSARAISRSNRHFWWALHELTYGDAALREEGRQAVIAVARDRPDFLRACRDAGLFNMNVVSPETGNLFEIKEPIA